MAKGNAPSVPLMSRLQKFLCPGLLQENLQLKDEVALLTRYTRDAIYRLRYDTMRYDYISPSVERLIGYSAEELQQMKFRDLIEETRIIRDELKPIHSFDQLEDTRRRGEVSKWQADYRLRRKDGKMIWVSDISYPWFDNDGAIIGSIGSLRDITDRVEAEQRALEEISRMSTTDELTGMLNRNNFFARLDEEFRRLKRTHEDLSLLIIDIDHFKKVNNDFGQKTGDLVIKEIAKIIALCLRETDLGARIGGEEFGVILPDTPPSGAHWVAERIRTKVSEQIFEFGSDEHLMGCTVSIGISSATYGQDMDASALYAMADNRLYIAKRTGRNRVSMDELVDA